MSKEKEPFEPLEPFGGYETVEEIEQAQKEAMERIKPKGSKKKESKYIIIHVVLMVALSVATYEYVVHFLI